MCYILQDLVRSRETGELRLRQLTHAHKRIRDNLAPNSPQLGQQGGGTHLFSALLGSDEISCDI